jgi:hypothetical protein
MYNLVFAVLLFAVGARAEDIFFFAGRIYDDRHMPVADATVTFRSTYTTQTDSTGLYHFETPLPIRNVVSKGIAHSSFTIKGSQLSCVLAQPEQVRIGIFDVRGRLVKSVNPGILQAGSHTLMLPVDKGHGSSAMPYIVRILCGKQTLVLRSIAGSTTGNASLLSSQTSQQGNYDYTALNDTLQLSKTGYYSRAVAIDSYADSIPDITFYPTSSIHPVLVRGMFAPGVLTTVTATIWRDSLDSIVDTLHTILPWNIDNSGAYSGIVYMYTHSASHVRLIVGDESATQIGYVQTMADTLIDTLTLNCRSSIPIVKLFADTSVGWGDTVRLHGIVTDSVDTIGQWAWTMNGSTFNVGSLSDTFAVIPMLTDSIYTCILSATDYSSNTTSDKITAKMTCSVRNFRLTNNDITGWTELSGTGYGLFEGTRIAGVLDTLAKTVQSSIKGVIKQSMSQTVSGNTRTMGAVVMDCSSRAQAKSLYAAYKNRIAATALTACPGYADSAAIIDNSLSDGCMVYACFKRFVIAVQLRGFIDYTTLLANASRFTRVYEQRAIKTSICRNE